MKKNILYFATLIMVILASCSKRTTPHIATNSRSENGAASTTKSSTIPKVKTPAPTVIVVSDAVAKKTIDGRYFYDLNGKRYWRNNRDGKYYLFNKSMYSNPDFNPPKN